MEFDLPTPQLPDDRFHALMDGQQLIGQDFIDAAFGHLFADHEDFRCPFPEEIVPEVAARTLRLFMERVLLASPHDLSGDLLGEWIQGIAIQVGAALARDDEERLTILFPSLPRAGDRVRMGPDPAGAVVVGKSVVGSGRKRSIRVDLRTDGGESLHAEFDLH